MYTYHTNCFQCKKCSTKKQRESVQTSKRWQTTKFRQATLEDVVQNDPERNESQYVGQRRKGRKKFQVSDQVYEYERYEADQHGYLNRYRFWQVDVQNIFQVDSYEHYVATTDSQLVDNQEDVD